jgi:hypothetical protein
MKHETTVNWHRRRCCECRRWYTPDPRAKRNQKTCGKQCRLHRRAKQEKARRDADLTNARAADQQRQMQWRARKHRVGQKERALSQAGLSAQTTEIIEIIMNKLRQEQRLSQAGFRRLLRGNLAKIGHGNASEVTKSGT